MGGAGNHPAALDDRERPELDATTGRLPDPAHKVARDDMGMWWVSRGIEWVGPCTTRDEAIDAARKLAWAA